MTVEFIVRTKVQSYSALLKNISADEHALLIHLKHKLQKEHENLEAEDDINYDLKVVEE